jgi:hypothetical protein
MKHLRRFNESINRDELKDFVEDCLVSLLDEGFHVFIPRVLLDGDSVAIWLSHSNQVVSLRNTGTLPYAKDYFTWDQIKDYYIPLLKLLSNRYDIIGFGEPSRGLEDLTSKVRFRLQPDYSSDAFKDFPYDKVVNDTLFGYYFYEPSIYSVGIMIKEKR